MAELARGNVADRPWGKTLAALGLRGLSGQLTLSDAGKRYQIAFQQGAVISAASPLASDAAARVALTSGLVSSTQVADVARKQAAAPTRDEIELIAELARLAPDQALRLRRRVVAQRAARTFSVDKGEFVVEDRITIPFVPGTEMDIRGVIYLGARVNLSEARLDAELAMFGASFRLRATAVEDLPQFGFSDLERPLLERLQGGATVAELVATGLDARIVRAAIYALASCNACDVEAARPKQRPATPEPPRTVAPEPPRTVTPAQPRTPTPEPPRTVTPARTPTSEPPRTVTPAQPRTATSPQPPTQPRTATSPQPPAGRPAPQPAAAPEAATVYRPREADPPTMRRSTTPELTTFRKRPASSQPPRRRVDTAQAADVQRLIDERLAMLERGVDHFTLLGVGRDASSEDLRKAYFGLARQLHPDRLTALGIVDETRRAQRLFAEVNAAFAELGDPKRRADYAQLIERGGAAAVAAEQAKAEQMAAKIVAAEEAFRRGEGALRRDQLAMATAEFAKAMELNPEEADYRALHAWAQFCGSPDKLAIASATRSALERAIAQSPRAVTARFYLGRVERMLGRDTEALRHFKEVLEKQPGHVEAGSEARVIEARLAAGSGDKDKGFFGRLKR